MHLNGTPYLGSTPENSNSGKDQPVALPPQVCHAVIMDNEETRKAKKLLEQAEDRERMARIVKRHEKPSERKTTPREEVHQEAARIVRDSTEH